jgi:hypothetical protein
MKITTKLPEVRIHPIYRDLMLILTAAFMVAAALVTAGFAMVQ